MSVRLCIHYSCSAVHCKFLIMSFQMLFRSRFIKCLQFVLLVTFTHVALATFFYQYMYVNEISMKGNSINVIPSNNIIDSNPSLSMKYILLWTGANDSPFVYFGTGQSTFLSRQCKWNNCYVTSDRSYLGFYNEFEVVMFHGPRLSQVVKSNDIPLKRSMHQKYVYANIEAATNYPVSAILWNGFFNWTWTYRLDSDAYWGYLSIRNATHHVIGPNLNIQWLDLLDMKQIDEELREKLKAKTRAAAWFSSNCNTLSKRESFVQKIQDELRQYGLKVDVYGACGNHHCPRDIMDKCLEVLENNYYFYFAFENALSEDYVTEKIVYALQHNTVPVVYGGANYTRFMPNGAYLNALELGPKELAKKIHEAIQSPKLYHSFFRWKKHYSYHFRGESFETDDYCNFCALLNDENAMQTTTIYERLDTWWTTNITYDDFTKE